MRVSGEEKVFYATRLDGVPVEVNVGGGVWRASFPRNVPEKHQCEEGGEARSHQSKPWEE